MKKLWIVLLCMLFIVGCGNEKASEIKGKQVSFGEKTISLGEDMESVKKKLGEKYELTESQSCLYDGMDKVFTYEKIIISTYPDGEKDYVSSIAFSDASATWKYAIQVGDSVDEVRTAMEGECTADEDYLLTYEVDGYGVSFSLEGGKVTEIAIYSL